MENEDERKWGLDCAMDRQINRWTKESSQPTNQPTNPPHQTTTRPKHPSTQTDSRPKDSPHGRKGRRAPKPEHRTSRRGPRLQEGTTAAGGDHGCRWVGGRARGAGGGGKGDVSGKKRVVNDTERRSRAREGGRKEWETAGDETASRVVKGSRDAEKQAGEKRKGGNQGG
ncbi:hypothetical protein MMC27_001113 [Xylographa pallens]|nr:hypothetical protein [Xylographa pallens]